eukprot:6180690-Pleurochrysis_carterae.AAC.1
MEATHTSSRGACPRDSHALLSSKTGRRAVRGDGARLPQWRQQPRHPGGKMGWRSARLSPGDAHSLALRTRLYTSCTPFRTCVTRCAVRSRSDRHNEGASSTVGCEAAWGARGGDDGGEEGGDGKVRSIRSRGVESLALGVGSAWAGGGTDGAGHGAAGVGMKEVAMPWHGGSRNRCCSSCVVRGCSATDMKS